MKALTILKRCRAADEDIERIRISIQQKWDILTNISAPQSDPNGGGHATGDRDKNAKIMGDIDALERKKTEREQRKAVELASGSALLDMVPQTESQVLYAYYIQRMDTTAVAAKLKYQPNYTRRKKRDGEKALDLLSAETVAGTLPRWYLEEETGREVKKK